MKIKNMIVAVSCLFALGACSDEMDYNEFVSYNKEQIFSSFSRTMQFVTDIYGHLDYDFGTMYSGAMLASASDEAHYAWTASGIHDFYNGSWSPANPKSWIWTNNYEGIRAVNFYLEASEGQTFSDFKYNKDYQDQMKRFERYQHEVRFIRAYLYFGLVKQYGDVPFTTKVLTDAEANVLSRTSAGVIFKFIIDECNAIVNELPIAYDDAYKETGRIPRGAVLALKARTLLYQASPLFNTSNDVSLWREAAIANKAVIDYCTANNIKLGSYSALWGTENYTNSEMIFARRIGDLNYLESYNFPIGVEGGNSGNCPTQTLVDAYEMKATGKLWNETGSGYNEDKPYEGRDPRFEMTIAKNSDKGWPTYNSTALQTYVGGANGAPISGATPTGYYLKKYLDASVDLRPSTSNTKRHSWITFRLAEFYLNYAEATFRYLGGADATNSELTITPREAINIVRQRNGVGMPALPIGLTIAEFEKKFENERMVELAFEGHRFWDVRRWKKGDVFKSVIFMQINKVSDESYTYTRIVRNRSWDDKMYFFPIPDSERRKNPNLTQNTGWSN